MIYLFQEINGHALVSLDKGGHNQKPDHVTNEFTVVGLFAEQGVIMTSEGRLRQCLCRQGKVFLWKVGSH